MKFQCYTLGCKVNQYETQAMEQQLLAHTDLPDLEVLVARQDHTFVKYTLRQLLPQGFGPDSLA